jgi:antibiotic biosynthesis monooxygenase (ABM) superfamily enzyme
VDGFPPGSVPRYKAAVITWLALYPALTVLLALLGPVLAPLPLFLRTLVGTTVLVPIMVYLLVPGMQRLFAGWLSPR